MINVNIFGVHSKIGFFGRGLRKNADEKGGGEGLIPQCTL